MLIGVCGILLMLTGCKSESGETTDSSSMVGNVEKKVKKDSSNLTKKFDYTYNPERPLWMLIEGTNELLKADGNYHTMVAMESVQDAEIRKNLQKKYDEGYALKLQLENDEPTGVIFLIKADKKNEELKIDKKLLNYQQGKKHADKVSENEKKQLEEKMGAPQDANNTQGVVKNFDEAVTQAKKWMGMTDEQAQEYFFYDFGLGNDGREFYQIMVRPKVETPNSQETQIKIYADNGEASYVE